MIYAIYPIRSLAEPRRSRGTFLSRRRWRPVEPIESIARLAYRTFTLCRSRRPPSRFALISLSKHRSGNTPI